MTSEDDETTNVLPEASPETIHAPEGLEAQLFTIEADGGFAFGWAATLPEAGYESDAESYPVCPTRDEAIVAACESIIAWAGTQKNDFTRGRKHLKKAQQLQAWALAVERERAAAQPVDADAATGTADDAIPGAEVDAMRDALRAMQPDSPAGDPASTNEEALPTSANLPVQLIPLDELWESPLNPRQIYPEREMQELAESMRQVGFREWQPLLVRPRSAFGVGGGYEIGAGHRRARAARMADLAAVPCIVRDMTDEEFLDVLNFDNSGREDVHPLHEAAGWRTWIEQTGKGVADIAQRLGRSAEYVYQRLQYSKLIGRAQELFLEGRIRESHAVEIARLEEQDQLAALEFVSPQFDPERHVSVRALREWIGEMEQRKREAAERFERRNAPPLPPHVLVQHIPPAPDPTDEPEPEPDRESPFEKRRREQQRADQERERQKAEYEQGEKETRDQARVERIYTRVMDAILAKLEWPIEPRDFEDLFAALVGGMNCHLELADKFAIPVTLNSRWQDILVATPKLPPAKLLRIAFAGILLDQAEETGFAMNLVVRGLASRHGVSIDKITAKVEEELNPKPAPPPPPPPAKKPATRKDAIARRPAMGDGAKKGGANKPAPKSAPKKKGKGKK